MPRYLITKWPNLPLTDLVPGGGVITDRRQSILRLMNRKWEITKDLLQPWVLRGEVAVIDDDKSLEMNPRTRKTLEAEFGLIFDMIRTRSQVSLPQKAGGALSVEAPTIMALGRDWIAESSA